MTRWKCCAAVVLSFFLTSMCGCFPPVGTNKFYEEDPAGKGARLKFFGYKTDAENVDAVESIIDSFMADNPDITVVYEGIGLQDGYGTLLQRRLETGNGDDIFMVSPSDYNEIQQKGYLKELSGLSTLSKFHEKISRTMYMDGHVYYIPLSISICAMFCNMDILRENGLHVPENYSDFLKVCDILKSKGIVPIISNNKNSLSTLVLARSMYPLYSSGKDGELVDRLNSGKMAPGTYLKSGLEMLEELKWEGYLDAEKTLKTAPMHDEVAGFANEQAVFMPAPVWYSPLIKKLNPKFYYEVHALPVLDGGSTVVLDLGSRICLNARGENQEAAMRFLEYCTQPEIINKYADSQSLLGTTQTLGMVKDKAVAPVIQYIFNSRNVAGTDDRLKLGLWEMVPKYASMVLQGENVDFITEQLNTAAKTMLEQEERRSGSEG